MSDTLQEDRQLLSKCLAGDRAAADSLVHRFSNLVYKAVQNTLLINQVSYTREDVEDLHNTVFLHLFENKCKKLRQYQGRNGCSLASWIRLVAVRIVLNELRRRGVDYIGSKRIRIGLDQVPELRESGDDTWSQLMQAERERLLEEGVRSLSPRYRLFIELHYYRGQTLADVATAMQLSMDNAYTLKHRAVQKLKMQIFSVDE
jgi:RNA polymerase sigma factor (sigma-70 family)